MDKTENLLDERLLFFRQKCKRKIRTAKKYLLKSEKQLLACQSWELKQKEADLLQVYLFQPHPNPDEIEAKSWDTEETLRIKINPHIKPQEELSKRFKEIRKLKNGLPYAIEELKKSEAELSLWMMRLTDLAIVKTAAELEPYELLFLEKNKKTRAHKIAAKPYKEYLSPIGVPIWVGKSAAANDQLTFIHANGNDLWLHVSEIPGSHVVIHIPSKKQIDEETMQLALQLALYHSQARNRGEAEVSVTLVKYVKRTRKKGLVQIANEKRYLIHLDLKKIAILHHL